MKINTTLFLNFKTYIITSFLVLVISSFSFAQTIIPDSTFNSTGNSLFTFYNNIDRGYGCAVQTDQKMVIAGLSKNQNTSFFELCIARFNVNGTLDTSFSGDGKAYVSMSNQSSIGGITPSIKLDANQKIVVVGSGRGSSSQDFLIARLNSNGSPDLSFNGSGYVFIDILGTNTQPDVANALDFDGSGNIYITGVVSVTPPFDNQLAVVKLTDAGLLDTSFDGDGKLQFNAGAGNEFGKGIAVLTSGNIVAGLNAGSNMALYCFSPAGIPVTSFGLSGYASISFSASSSMSAISVDNSGRIVVCGTVLNSNDDIAVARYLVNGTPDASFGTAGKFQADINGLDDNLNALCILNNNKIIVAGSASYAGTGFDFLVARIDTNGTIDNSFNNNTGFFKSNSSSPNANEAFNGVAVLANGSLFMSGTVNISSAVNEDVFVMRIKNIGPLAIETHTETKEFALYPNPFLTQITLVSSLNATYLIKDVSGKIIRTINLKAGSTILNLAELKKGIYFIQNTATGSTSKLIKLN